MNPLSWVLRPLFLVGFFYGVYLHDWLYISICFIGVTTSWFWFPPPKKNFAHTGELIDAEIDYLRKPFRGRKAIELTLGIAAIVWATVAFWQLKALTGIIILQALLVYKLVWVVELARKASWVPAVLIFIIVAILSAMAWVYYLTMTLFQF